MRVEVKTMQRLTFLLCVPSPLLTYGGEEGCFILLLSFTLDI